MNIVPKQKIYTISELTANIKSLLETNIGYVWITGEISNFSRDSTKGHLRFSLKDEQALIRCWMWGHNAASLNFEVEDGLQVVAFGKTSLWAQGGMYQFYIEMLEPKGIGALQLRFEQLKQRLEKEGLFDEKRKRKLPFLSRKIAVVTSIDGAALHDIVTTVLKRLPNIHILIHPVKVQGEGAANDVAKAITLINEKLPDVDCIIVGRGGGSIEDLWAFNEEIVAKAIYASRIPVISAVGHETDFTISDFVADVRAKTPTHAATIVVPELDELLLKLAQSTQQLNEAILNRVRLTGKILDGYRDSYALATPKTLYDQYMQSTDVLFDHLISALRNTAVQARSRLELSSQNYLIREPHKMLERSQERLAILAQSEGFANTKAMVDKYRAILPRAESQMDNRIKSMAEGSMNKLTGLAGQLESLSPLNVLARGYSITRLNGNILHDARKVKVGDTIKSTLHKGSIESQITRIEDSLF